MAIKPIFFLVLLFFAFSVSAKTYPIVEEDFTASIKTYADSQEFKLKSELKAKKRKEEILDYKGVYLPKASDNSTYEVAYSYTLTREIPRVDKYGNIIGVLYPKGYTFNPLLYLVQAPPPIIVFNPCDYKERKFVSDYLEKNNISLRMLVSTGCALKDIKGYDEFVYPLDAQAVEKFKLRSSVSIISVNINKGVFNVRVFETNNLK